MERVRDLLAVLKRTRHCGFPVVDVSDEHGLPYFSGLILRRQLLSLLHSRVWLYQREGGELPGELKGRFLSSARARYPPPPGGLDCTVSPPTGYANPPTSLPPTRPLS